MQYLRTRLATNFSKPSTLWEKLISYATSNPGYRGKFHRVRAWLIEFDEEGKPYREVGLDENDSVVLAGPGKNDYGFWLDTNMRYSDFTGESVTMEYFETKWAASGVVAP